MYGDGYIPSNPIDNPIMQLNSISEGEMSLRNTSRLTSNKTDNGGGEQQQQLTQHEAMIRNR